VHNIVGHISKRRQRAGPVAGGSNTGAMWTQISAKKVEEGFRSSSASLTFCALGFTLAGDDRLPLLGSQAKTVAVAVPVPAATVSDVMANAFAQQGVSCS